MKHKSRPLKATLLERSQRAAALATALTVQSALLKLQIKQEKLNRRKGKLDAARNQALEECKSLGLTCEDTLQDASQDTLLADFFSKAQSLVACTDMTSGPNVNLTGNMTRTTPTRRNHPSRQTGSSPRRHTPIIQRSSPTQSHVELDESLDFIGGQGEYAERFGEVM